MARVHLVTGWSVERGDCAYVEADDPAAACDALAAELQRRDQDDGATPRDQWIAIALSEPICIIQWRD